MSDLEFRRTCVALSLQCTCKLSLHIYMNISYFPFLPRCMKCRRGIAMRILSVRPSVCLSVCPSVTRVIPGKTEERSVQIFKPYERTFSLVF